MTAAKAPAATYAPPSPSGTATAATREPKFEAWAHAASATPKRNREGTTIHRRPYRSESIPATNVTTTPGSSKAVLKKLTCTCEMLNVCAISGKAGGTLEVPKMDMSVMPRPRAARDASKPTGLAPPPRSSWPSPSARAATILLGLCAPKPPFSRIRCLFRSLCVFCTYNPDVKDGTLLTGKDSLRYAAGLRKQGQDGPRSGRQGDGMDCDRIRLLAPAGKG